MAVKEYAPSNHNRETEKILEPSPELITAVDEVFAEQVDVLESLPIDPELEMQMGPGVKEAIPNDRTQGTKSY